MEDWCRSCGQRHPSTGGVGACVNCGTDLALPPVADSPLGRVHRLRGRLLVNRKNAICVGEQGGTLTLHVDAASEPVTVAAAEVDEPVDLVPHELSPAGRLVYANRLDRGSARSNWEPDALLAAAGELLAADIAARRQLATEALELQWPDIFEWLDLSPPEKAWIQAHEAARRGELASLRQHLAALPPDGYDPRVDLVLPHLPSVRQDAPAWLELLREWRDAGIPRADALGTLLEGRFEPAAAAAAELFAHVGEQQIAATWRQMVESIEAGEPIAPPVEDAPYWRAAHAYVRGRAGTTLDAEVAALEVLPGPLLDDLIDVGALTSAIDTEALPVPMRLHLLARLAPAALTEPELGEADHPAELARRRFLARDRRGLQGLRDDPAVEHYRVLLDVVDGKRPDREKLRPETVDLLELVDRSGEAVRSGEAAALPAPIVSDPTLWELFAEPARRGQLRLDREERERSPEFAHWLDLQRLLGLVWERRWKDASDLGDGLIRELDGRPAAEARNLTAFALHQGGADEQALEILEEALEKGPTEQLLINASILASTLKPEESGRHFARIFQEASRPELRVAAMERAVSVWLQADDTSAFPVELKDPLASVLESPCSLDQYVGFARLTANVEPRVLIRAIDPGDRRSGPYRFHRARARFLDEDDYTVEQLVADIVEVQRDHGQASWFASDWEQLVALFRDATFVDFGEGLVAAVFWDNVLLTAPDLLEPFDRLLFLPQAGAHFAVAFDKDDSFLAEHAFEKFFFTPAEELLANTHGLEQGAVEFLAGNLSKTLYLASFGHIRNARTSSAEEYNPLAQRLGWDGQNRFEIIGMMRRILDTDLDNIHLADRALDRLKRLDVPSDEHRERVRELSAALDGWREETTRLRANL